MKLSDIIANIDKSPENTTWSDPDVFTNLFGMNWVNSYEDFESRVKKYWISSWMCTDTQVGICLYVFDEVPLAIGVKKFRKDDEVTTLICDPETKREFLEFLIPLTINEAKQIPIDLKEDFGDGYRVHYGNQIRRRFAYHEGHPVQVISFTNSYTTEIRILKEGQELNVEATSLVFPWHTDKGTP